MLPTKYLIGGNYALYEAGSDLDANFNIKNIAAAAITTPTAPPIFMIDS